MRVRFGPIYLDPDGGFTIKQGTGFVKLTTSMIVDALVEAYGVDALRGPQGAAGSRGAAGASGTDGRTILTTRGRPSDATGVNGDFAIDPTPGSQSLYGPKASGTWPAGVSLAGPAGDPGAPGTPGRDATLTDGSVAARHLAAALKPSGGAVAGDEALRRIGTGANDAAAGTLGLGAPGSSTNPHASASAPRNDALSVNWWACASRPFNAVARDLWIRTPSKLLLGTEGQSGWPAIIPGAYAAFPFRCARLSDSWPTLGDAITAHGRLGVEVHLLVEDWSTSPSTIVATLQRYPTLTNVELGNEDSYSYKNGSNVSTMRTKAGNYARAVVALRTAMDAVGLTRVGIIAQNDYALWSGSSWVDAMYAAVPGLHRYVRAWCCHPYFAHEEVHRITTAISQAAAHGCPTDFPIWLTEFGVATSGGTAFTDPDGNYNRALDLTYAQAAAELTKVIKRIADECPSVERLFWFGMIDAGTDPRRREQNFGYLLNDQTAKPEIPGALTALLDYTPVQRVRVRGALASGGSTGTTLNATQPSETRAGDPLLCGVYVTGADVDIAMAGFTERRDLFCASPGVFNFAVFEGVATVDGAATHAITWGGASRFRGATIVAFDQATVHPSRLIDAEGDVVSPTASRTVTGPRLTTTVANTRVLWWAVTDLASVITTPADITTIEDGAIGAPMVALADDPTGAIGTTAELTGTQTASIPFIVAAQAISPSLEVPVEADEDGPFIAVDLYRHNGLG